MGSEQDRFAQGDGSRSANDFAGESSFGAGTESNYNPVQLYREGFQSGVFRG